MEADNTWRQDVPGTQRNGVLRRQLAEGPALGTLPYEGVIPHNNLAKPVFIFVVIPNGVITEKKGKVCLKIKIPIIFNNVKCPAFRGGNSIVNNVPSGKINIILGGYYLC
jgi:hypothetical protein